MARSPDRILDELLVLKCQAGDAQAFDELVRRWHAPLRRHAWYLTRDQDATRDVVQEAWLDIVRSIGQLREPASFRGWAYRIVGHKAADWFRRSKRMRQFREEMARREESVRGEPLPDDDDAQTRIRRGIRLLPASSRQILSMKYLDGLLVREIADALDIPPGTVKSRLHYARDQLKQILQREDR